MPATQIQLHLQQLEAVRAIAALEGLASNATYMAALNGQIAIARSAYVGAAVTEIATLRRAVGAASGLDRDPMAHTTAAPEPTRPSLVPCGRARQHVARSRHHVGSNTLVIAGALAGASDLGASRVPVAVLAPREPSARLVFRRRRSGRCLADADGEVAMCPSDAGPEASSQRSCSATPLGLS
jgi:hypothetical protein